MGHVEIVTRLVSVILHPPLHMYNHFFLNIFKASFCFLSYCYVLLPATWTSGLTGFFFGGGGNHQLLLLCLVFRHYADIGARAALYC